LNLASALIFRVLELEDFDTWTNVRRHYLPSEHQALFDVITKHADTFHKLPTLEELRLGIRDAATLDKVYALESIETEAEPYFLLEAIKSEYAQREALVQMDKWVDSSMAFETAEEVVRHIQQIGIDLEAKIELVPPEETMQRISLFDSEEEMANRITLGLNTDFDSRFDFNPSDLILVGGFRGSGKSLVCSNVCNVMVNERKKKALYFTIEMPTRQILQRDCAISTGIPFWKIKKKEMTVQEWDLTAHWWSTRFVDGEEIYHDYLKHRSFDKFHSVVSKQELVPAHLDIVYDPGLTLGRINSEIDKRLARGEEIGLVAVDYINKVSRTGGGFNHDNLDWKEQILVSNYLKNIAGDRDLPIVSPYQTDKTGEVRLGKGILDACDAAMRLIAHKGDVPSMTFVTEKMRGADDTEEFTSEVNWNTLKIGPRSVEKPEAPNDGKKGNKSTDISVKTSGVYDA
jgi:replicative DNA helicase